MRNHIRRKRNRGFTLIELLVVMAISLILMGLVMAPVVRTFELTRRAQAMVEAQDSARSAADQITREISQAMDVLDYTAEPLEVPVYNPKDGSTYWLKIPHAKIDLAMPQMVAHCNNPNHPADQPREFPRGNMALPPCPACTQAGIAQPGDVEIIPRLPIELGSTVVRYFLGLRYNNPNPAATDTPPHPGWQSPYGNDTKANEGNQVVLYRIEFDPNDAQVFGGDKNEAIKRMMEALRDPQFFYRTSYDSWSPPNNGQLWQLWASRAREIGLAKYEDLVSGIDISDPGKPGDGVYEALEPSVTFRYAKVDNDPFIGVDYGNLGAEYPDAAPTVYRAKFGYWTPNTFVGITDPYRISLLRSSDGAEYFTGTDGTNLCIYKSAGGSGQTLVFNISDYMGKGYLDYDNIAADTEMAYYFDYSMDPNGPLMNFDRGAVNFALEVKPFELQPKDIAKINQDFHSRLFTDRNTYARVCRLPALAKLNYATVVPGSELVIGPDMNPGPTWGQPVQYQRVPFTVAGAEANEYRINYQTGDVFFSRIERQDIPETVPLTIRYQVRFNKNTDVVQGSYETRAAIDMHIGMRIYDPDSAKPHMVDLTSRAQLRNAHR